MGDVGEQRHTENEEAEDVDMRTRTDGHCALRAGGRSNTVQIASRPVSDDRRWQARSTIIIEAPYKPASWCADVTTPA